MCRHHISIDLETQSGADITKTGSYRYVQDPDFRILLFGYQIDDGPVEVIDLTKGDGKLPQKIVTILQNPSYIKHAYNAAFEWHALNRAGYPTPIEHWQCTMVWSLYCGYAAGLANTGEAIGLPEDKKKNLTGKALIRYFCTPQKETKTFKRKYHVPEDDPDKWELFIEYNRQDVVAEYNILQRLKAFPVPESEWELWRMDIRMNALGVKVDTKLIRGALEIDAQSTKALTDQAVKLTGLANPNSQAQLLPWLQEHGCDITDLQKLTVEETLQRDDLSPEVREVLRLRQLLGKTSIKKYVAMETAVGEGDRVRGISQFYGANRTGRYCLTGDHEVLTPNGWVRLDEWKGGRILCWEPTMEKLSFQKSESLQFDYSGPMYHYEGQRISQVATPDHKMAVLAKDGTWEAKTVKEIDIHRFTIPFTGKRITDRPYRDDQIRVLIMTQADGFYTDDGGIKYNFAKKRKVERCKSLLRKCGITFIERIFKKGVTCITVPWRYAPLWLRQFRDKTFGYWLLDENLSVVMEELPEWDGYRCGPNSIQYATTNEINADVIQACALCNGMSATKVVKRHKVDNWSTAYYVNIWLTPGRGTAIRREQVSIEEMNGIKVHCAKTPTGYFAVRRNGRIWITGNSGRLVQLQNLPRNYLSTLDAARRMVREGDYEAVRMIYGNIPDTLSQLIRTAFIPSEGRHFVVADFSAIEARMIAWMAGEQWVSDVFARGDDIYCETASAMFGVPVGKHGPNAELRQKGKIATLALGYQGGPAAMIAMGALRMGIPEEDLPDIVTKWRKTHPKTVAMWYQLEEVMVRVVSTGVGEAFPIAGGKAQLIFRLETDLVFGQSFLTIELPVGRKLFYPKPYLKENKFGKLAVHYYGVNQTSGKWGPESTYGGKVTENCLAGNTMVITDHGIVPITDVSINMKLWDGVEWVSHEGVLDKGIQETICVDRVRMTPDHLIYSKEGWKRADEAETSGRDDIQWDYRAFDEGYRRAQVDMECEMRILRKDIPYDFFRDPQGKAEIMRLHDVEVSESGQQKTRDVGHSNLECVAFDEGTVRDPDGAGLEELRWPWDPGVQRMVRELREISGRHGADLPEGPDARQNRRKWQLLPGKLQVDNYEGAGQEQTQEPLHQHSEGQDDGSRSVGDIRDRGDYYPVPDGPRSAGRFAVSKTRLPERVYDIRNAGPRHCFYVMSDHGPMKVHNCVQAVARDCLCEVIRRIYAKGWDLVFHVHDEVIIDVSTDVDESDLCALMDEPISWAPGLLLKGAGFTSNYYMKD